MSEIILPPGPFEIIYADPAWKFDNKRTGGSMSSGASQKYTTMTVEQMMAMPVADIAADNCVLVMWWVGSMNQEALDLAKAWGFKVITSTGFVWNKLTKYGKPHFGMGRWTRAGAECALIATKGKPKRVDASIRSVRSSPVGRHSQKPAAFRQDIIKLCGDVPRVELFARHNDPGWETWGDGV